MNATARIRNLTRRNFSSLTTAQIAQRVGMSRSAAFRFMSGGNGSIKIAQYMADTFGGVFIRLLAQYKAETAEANRIKMALARSRRAMAFPSPSMIVSMPEQLAETHHVPPTNISACWPVLYKQAEVVA